MQQAAPFLATRCGVGSAGQGRLLPVLPALAAEGQGQPGCALGPRLLSLSKAVPWQGDCAYHRQKVLWVRGR